MVDHILVKPVKVSHIQRYKNQDGVTFLLHYLTNFTVQYLHAQLTLPRIVSRFCFYDTNIYRIVYCVAINLKYRYFWFLYQKLICILFENCKEKLLETSRYYQINISTCVFVIRRISYIIIRSQNKCVICILNRFIITMHIYNIGITVYTSKTKYLIFF